MSCKRKPRRNELTRWKAEDRNTQRRVSAKVRVRRREKEKQKYMRLLLGTSKRQIEHKDKEKEKTTREKELEAKGYYPYKLVWDRRGMQNKKESEIQRSKNEKGKERERLLVGDGWKMKDKEKNNKRERETIARIEKTLWTVWASTRKSARKARERDRNKLQEWRVGKGIGNRAESRPEEKSNGGWSGATSMVSEGTQRGRDREAIRRGKEVKREEESATHS